MRAARSLPRWDASADQQSDDRAAFNAAYGTAFVLELRDQRARGAELRPELLLKVAHEATTVARSAVLGRRNLERGDST